MTTIPADAATVTHWYKQAVYDPSNTRIGEIDDALILGQRVPACRHEPHQETRLPATAVGAQHYGGAVDARRGRVQHK